MKIKVLLKSLEKIIDKNISVFDRGVLITLILTKNDDPTTHWAVFKTKVKYNDFMKESLIRLQDKKFIEWSGYKSAKESLKKKQDDPIVLDILNFMNNIYGTNFKNTKSSTEGLRARLKDYSVDDIKLVISNRWEEWKDDPYMSKYLTPQTIFRPSKFEKYIVQAKKSGVGESSVNVNKINLNKGDIISYQISQTFSDKDTYQVKRCELKSGEINTLSGSIEVLYGKDIKKDLKLAENKQKRGITVNEVFLYWPKN